MNHFSPEFQPSMSPDEGNGGNGDAEFESTEDVLRQVREIFEDRISPETKEIHLKSTHNFLAAFKVKDAELADLSEIEFLWERLDRNPAQIKDFVYMVTDISTMLSLKEYPLMPHMSDLWMYAHDMDDPSYTIRDTWRTNNVVPNLTRLGVDKDEVVAKATADLEGKVRTSEGVRFLGWLTGQPFMANLPYELGQFIQEIGEEQPSLDHVAAVAYLEVKKHLRRLRLMERRYRDRIPLEVEARPAYNDGLEAIEGTWNLCNVLLLGRPTQE